MSVGDITPQVPVGAQVKGPVAVGRDWKRFITLTLTLAVTDFKLRFYGSALGYLWQLMRPLMLFAILYLVFSQALRFGEGIKHFPVMLLAGIVLFTFLHDATTGAVTSVVDREPVVRKIDFPRLVIPMAVVTTAVFNLALNLLAVCVFIAISRVEITWKVIELPLILGALFVLVVGIAMVVSALYARYRDVRPIWEVIVQIIFYGSPVIYPIEIITDEKIRELVMLNPFAMVVQQFRHAVIDPSTPGAVTVAGGWSRIVIPLGVTVALLVIGVWIFHRQAPRIAEDL